jgi:diguanylate cyclase
MHRLVPYEDFSSASKATLTLLRERMGFRLWMITRTEGNDWIVLHSEYDDPNYNVTPGTVLKWSDSYCSRMIRGEGPQLAPVAKNISTYLEAPINDCLEIGAYLGLPLLRRDGSLFGTLCAIDPEAQPESIRQELPLVKTLVRLLTSVLCAELEKLDEARQTEGMNGVLPVDAFGLLGIPGWEQRLELEDARVARYGSPTSVVSVQLHSHLDASQVAQTAEVLASVIRSSDALAEAGGGEFMVLAVETDGEASQSLFRRIQLALEQAQLDAAVGFAIRAAHASLLETWHEAQQAMLANQAWQFNNRH